jgi:uncharacterized protein (TIGR03382 family)
MKFPGALAIALAGTALLGLGTPTALADTTVPDFPSWWKGPGDLPDGVTRTQFHAFHADPNTMPSPDWVYDGFDPVLPDIWNTAIVTAFDVDRPGGVSPFVDDQGTRHGDTVAKGAQISLEGGQMTKQMGNLPQADWIKLFHAEIIWFGGDTANDVSITVQATGFVNITQAATITDADPNWHFTYIDGYIDPQPDVETFSFNFAAVTNPIFVDAVYVGTHCIIPAPAALPLLALGCLAVRRRRRR